MKFSFGICFRYQIIQETNKLSMYSMCYKIIEFSIKSVFNWMKLKFKLRFYALNKPLNLPFIVLFLIILISFNSLHELDRKTARRGPLRHIFSCSLLNYSNVTKKLYFYKVYIYVKKRQHSIETI